MPDKPMTTEELIAALVEHQMAFDSVAQFMSPAGRDHAELLRTAIARLRSADKMFAHHISFAWKAHRWHIERDVENWRSGAADPEEGAHG